MGYITTLFYLREYFFPSGCGGCGNQLLSAEDAYYGLCAECRGFALDFFKGEKHCGICGEPLITEKDTCLSCRVRTEAGNNRYSESIIKMKAFFPYTGRFKLILGAYKFKKFLGLGNFLSYTLNLSLERFDTEILKDAAWVPVPPRPGKIRTQGWDQIDFLAKLLEKEYRHSRQPLCLPVRRCLKRLPSRSQKELNREERATNLKGRILCIKKPPATAILFDDIITTGATMNTCAAALLEGGAEKVYGICLFYD
jgi:ComF family protein